MPLDQTDVTIPTPAGQMPAFLCQPTGGDRPAGPVFDQRLPAVLLLMEAFGLTDHIRDVARRLADAGYLVLAPNLYYREGASLTFGYGEVDQAMAAMYRLDFGQPIEQDLKAAIAFLKASPAVAPDRIGVTGFCLGGGLTFLAACRFSSEIAAAAPFYGMVLDEWIEAMADIAVPMRLFFGGQDPFIGRDRIQQIETRFRHLGKPYTLTVYPEAGHGFFCHERQCYNAAAAAAAWQALTAFLSATLGGTPLASKPI